MSESETAMLTFVVNVIFEDLLVAYLVDKNK